MKKYIVFAVVLLLLGIGGIVALADNNTPVAGAVVVNINPNGQVLLRGAVQSVGTDSVVVKSWGGEWTIKVTTTTQIMSAAQKLSDFVVGDFVGVSGTISQDGDFIIDAKILRKWGARMDSDKDGISDDQDVDDDNDGIPDVNDSKPKDHDDDGIIDSVDTDDDNDGILDVNESGKWRDHDNDGISDARDMDDDNDDIEDSKDLHQDDHDNDGVDDDEDDDNGSDHKNSGSNSSNSGSGSSHSGENDDNNDDN